MNLLNLLMNPVRIMIMQYLTTHKTAIASEIITHLSNVSRATVYNHLKILEENNLISVIQENQIRGTVEKVYSIKEVEDDNHASYTTVINYLLYLMMDFQKYFENTQGVMHEDMLYVDRTVMYLNDKDFQSFFQEYTELCEKYFSNESMTDKRGRTISLISSPFINGYQEQYENNLKSE